MNFSTSPRSRNKRRPMRVSGSLRLQTREPHIQGVPPNSSTVWEIVKRRFAECCGKVLVLLMLPPLSCHHGGRSGRLVIGPRCPSPDGLGVPWHKRLRLCPEDFLRVTLQKSGPQSLFILFNGIAIVQLPRNRAGVNAQGVCKILLRIESFKNPQLGLLLIYHRRSPLGERF